MKNIMLLASAFLLCQSANAAGSTTIECLAKGKVMSQNGSGLLDSDSNLVFDLSQDNSTNQRTISSIRGEVKVGTIDNNDPVLNNENAYVGIFDTTSIAENLKYRPVRYKGYSQYKDLNAAKTTGQENGMWGDLVLEQDISAAKFEAHYIFRAGDHMGGTLHFTCTKK